MVLKLACADFTFPLLPHEKVLDLIAMLQVEGVDVGLFQDRSHLQPLSEFTDIKGNGAKLGRKLKERGLKAADVFLQTALDFVSVAPNHPDDNIRKKSRDLFLKTLEYTLECGGKHVSALPGVYFEDEPKDASFKRCCEELQWRCERAKEQGIVFSVEAHLGSIAPTPEEAEALVNSTPGLTLTLDYTHFSKLGMADERVKPLIKHASHFHARGAAEGRLQTSVKENTIDYTEILKEMKKTGYNGYVGLEYVWQDWERCNEVDNLSETILLRDLLLEEYGKM